MTMDSIIAEILELSPGMFPIYIYHYNSLIVEITYDVDKVTDVCYWTMYIYNAQTRSLLCKVTPIESKTDLCFQVIQHYKDMLCIMKPRNIFIIPRLMMDPWLYGHDTSDKLHFCDTCDNDKYETTYVTNFPTLCRYISKGEICTKCLPCPDFMKEFNYILDLNNRLCECAYLYQRDNGNN